MKKKLWFILIPVLVALLVVALVVTLLILKGRKGNDTRFEIGSIVTYGCYEQDGNTKNGKEPIEWIVMEQDGNKVLLLSRYGLASSNYGSTHEWKNSKIRSWLNDSFLNSAFINAERAGILDTKVDNSSDQNYSGYTVGGSENTTDKLFLLSYAEAARFFGIQDENITNVQENPAARCAPTLYERGQYNSEGFYTQYPTAANESAGCWWLRSPGARENCNIYIHAHGKFGYHWSNNFTLLVRPAMWVEADSLTSNKTEGAR